MSHKKTLLLVTWFNPNANYVASLRWKNFVHYLSESYDIYLFTTVLNNNMANIANVKKVYYGRTVIGSQLTPSSNNGLIRRLYKWMKSPLVWLRSIGVCWYTWYFKNRSNFLNVYTEVNPDYLITSIGPFSTALFGYAIKKKNPSVKWMVDIRDSVSLNNVEHKPLWAKYMDALIDKQIIKKADSVITVGYELSKILGSFYGKEVHTVYNSFNSNKAPHVKNLNHQIYYAGKIYPHRIPALKLMFNVLKKNKTLNLKIRLIGTREGAIFLEKLILENNIVSQVSLLPPTDHETVKKEEFESSILLVLEDLNKQSSISKGTITGKLFELLPCPSPILAIARGDSEIGDILTKTSRGQLCDNLADIESFFQNAQAYECHAFDDIKEFSSKTQAKKVDMLLKSMP